MDALDPGLIARAVDGDRQAFAELVERLHPRALRFAHRMLGETSDAEDVVQDTFIRVWKALPRFRVGAPFDPWFFKILGNRCRTALERRKRDATEVLEPELVAEASAPDPYQLDEVHRVLNTLPAEQREAFLLYHVEGFSYEEIAQVTGAGLSALRMRVKRAMDTLRARLVEVTHA
ncbi:MAG: RNA polymerase sigma factor [Gemmatimonadaceae bacterium]|nr:RNA polymerase sigma factor [Gemmatimonadaceae bacterium]